MTLLRIAFVGCGGKTTSMFALGRFLAKNQDVVISTTTKIYPPKEETFLCPYEGGPIPPGLVVLGGDVKEGKVLPVEEEFLPKEGIHLYEADGSKGYFLKAWRDHEPVLLPKTTHTVGCLNAKVLGRPISEVTMNEEAFRQVFGGEEIVDEALLRRVITSPFGLFRRAQGRKVFFLNGCDTIEEREEGAALLLRMNLPEDITLFLGSAEKGEAIMVPRIGAILMASGESKRMGEQKLHLSIEGKEMITHALEVIAACPFAQRIVVTNDERIAAQATEMGFTVVGNPNASVGKSASIHQGIAALCEVEGMMFFVGDQPFLTKETVLRLMDAFDLDEEKIVTPFYDKKRGAPVLFPKSYRQSLLDLTGDEGGVKLITGENLLRVDIEDGKEGADIDTKEEYERWR